MKDRGMLHLNGNLLCAVDTETTGLIPGYHDVWQLCILPLGPDIKPLKEILPFYIDLKVKRPQNIDQHAIKLSRGEFAKRQQRALDPWDAAEMFEDWFERLKLSVHKKLCPLASNWPFDKSFIIDWLGPETYEYCFFHRYRDTMVAADFLNDIADHRNDKIKYPFVGIKALGGKLGVTNLKAHDALQDCITTAEIYRRLIMSAI